MASTWGDLLLLVVTVDTIHLCYSSMAGNLHTAPKCGFTGLQTFLSSICKLNSVFHLTSRLRVLIWDK